LVLFIGVLPVSDGNQQGFHLLQPGEITAVAPTFMGGMTTKTPTFRERMIKKPMFESKTSWESTRGLGYVVGEASSSMESSGRRSFAARHSVCTL
jgi:hypothetical protein